MSTETGLVFDATNKWVAVGIFSDEISLERNMLAERSASDLLIPVIKELLKEAKISRPDWIVCALGPGSFTGIRICVTTARNLSQLWRIPVMGVDSLSLYCYHSIINIRKTKNKRIAVLIDGKQNKVYARVVDINSNPQEFPDTQLYDISPARLFNEIHGAVEFYADDVEAVTDYIKLNPIGQANGQNQSDAGGDNFNINIPPLQAIPLLEAKSLYNFALLLSGEKRRGNWKNLLPIYLRKDPATEKYPEGYNKH